MVGLRDVNTNTQLSQEVWRAIFTPYTSDLQKLESNQKHCGSENSKKITRQSASLSIRVFSCTFADNFRFLRALILF